MNPVLIVGAGPAGCVSALTLRKLGHEVVLFERAGAPEYKIGESLLPGTLSILHRLGLKDRLDAAKFVKKPSATFIWGADEEPWTFSFATARPEPWIYDHAIQVLRSEFDGILLDAVKEAGVEVRAGHSVSGIESSRPDDVEVQWTANGQSGTQRGSYVIDCTGQAGLIAKKHELRRYDAFYRSLAVWNYFPATRAFSGDLNGTTFSITFRDGWIWMIPLKDGTYSVGAVVDTEASREIQALGASAFLDRCLRSAPEVHTIVDLSQPRSETRIIREWSYDATRFSFGRVFMCGDAACFTDPLFSQGVHLATQSAVCAAGAIDALAKNPAHADAVHQWFDTSYRESYSQYHEFLASFYSHASRLMPSSAFWSKRRVQDFADKRFANTLWMKSLTGQAEPEAGGEGAVIDQFVGRSGTMIGIGQHLRKELHADFSEAELSQKRLMWVANLTKSLNRIQKFSWVGDEARLVPTFKVDPLSFRLREEAIVANERGVTMSKYPLNEKYLAVLQALKHEEVGYKELMRRFQALDQPEVASQIIIRLLEAGLLRGYDKKGERVAIQKRLRFDGVGAEYEV
ncbi:MAG: tryptophan 7-halogenase [Myxococcaceae bacterium]|nr:tryptophan 7-halogenase [Myxococcaceae bacterium]